MAKQQQPTATTPTEIVSSAELFRLVKIISRNDKAIFLRYLLTQFGDEEIISMIMDRKYQLNLK